jgi:hypothetical protein
MRYKKSPTADTCCHLNVAARAGWVSFNEGFKGLSVLLETNVSRYLQAHHLDSTKPDLQL